MGANNSKRINHLSRDEKRWLESQDPGQIAALITAARISQSLTGLAGAELSKQATPMLAGKHPDPFMANHHPSAHQSISAHLNGNNNNAIANHPHHSHQATTHATNWQIQSLNNASDYSPSPSANGGAGVRSTANNKHLYNNSRGKLRQYQQQYQHSHARPFQQHRASTALSPQPSLEGADSLLNGVYSNTNSIDRLNRAERELEVYYGDEGVALGGAKTTTLYNSHHRLSDNNIDCNSDCCIYCLDYPARQPSRHNNINNQFHPLSQHPIYTNHTNYNNNNNNINNINTLHHNVRQSQQAIFANINERISNNFPHESSNPARKNLKTLANSNQLSNGPQENNHHIKNLSPYSVTMESDNQRGLNFTSKQRSQLGLTGLLPPAHQSIETQINWVLNYLKDCCGDDPLVKYVFLRNLKDFNETLFYATLMSNVETLMPIVYTPIVGLACQKFSSIYMKPRGLFISLQDQGNVSEILSNWKEKDVRVIVVTDGERILGLGDLGANGMGISIGKLSLYTALAGVPPKNALPVTLDVGTNNEINLADPFYIGLRQKRVRGQQYNALVKEFMESVVERWGRSCLIQFEDFGNQNAFALLQQYRASYCTFNDDIQGTASVCLSGLISATKMTDKRLRDMQFLFYGSGEANLGTANLLEMAMIEQGVDVNEAKSRIWLVDSKGLVVKSRSDLTEHKLIYAQEGPQMEKLLDIIKHVKPNAIVGASAQGGAFDEAVCKLMARQNRRPIIFALSNPTSKAECTARQAYEWTQGECIFASGSPFEAVEYNGRRYVTGQGNNAYIFPAVGLAAIAGHMHTIPEECFLVAATALSDLLTPSEISVGLVYPSLTRIRECTLKIAARLLEYFYCERLATYRPEPNDKVSFLRSIQYNATYPSIPDVVSTD